MKRILYIEDDKDIAEAVKILLNNNGFVTELAYSGIEGIKKAKEELYNLVLLDVMLPDMSGWDIFNILTEENKDKNHKFAFLSAIPISNDRINELNKVGISDYIIKPFSKQDLIKRINKIFNHKILYIEDNSDTAEAVKILLNNAGYITEIACSGAEGLTKANEGNFDLFILDIMLPDMSGWDIFERLKKQNEEHKFVFLTSLEADKNRINELKDNGVRDYITKPFSKDDLIKRVNKIVI